MQTIIVKLEESQHRKFKAACARKGTSMSQVLREAVDAMLHPNGKAPETPHDGREGA